jgi:hypothetical protein
MASSTDQQRRERQRMQQLSAVLRDAACAALARQSILAGALDETRGELERLLMLDRVDTEVRRRAVVRAQIMIDAWRGLC